MSGARPNDPMNRLDSRARHDAEAGGPECAVCDVLEILLYLTPAGRLALHVDVSGLPSATRLFRSATELGDWIATLLAQRAELEHPILAALHEAARRLPRAEARRDAPRVE